MKDHVTVADAVTIRPGTPEDTDLLIEVFTLASEGIANHFWTQIADRDGIPVDEVARIRTSAKLSDPQNIVRIAEVEGRPAGAILAYPVPDTPEDLDGLPPLVVPLVSLENKAAGTLYVNVLAVLPGFRRRGIASRLLAEAGRVGGGRPLSLIVSDANTDARTTYEAFGFRYGPSETMVKDGWQGRGAKWFLMMTEPQVSFSG